MVFFLGAIPASATFAVRHDTHGACSAHPCSLTVPSTTAGDLAVVIYFDSAGSARTISSVSDGTSTYTVPSGCNLFSNGNLNCAYSLSLAGGKTSVTLTMNAAGTDGNFEFIEYSYTGSSVSFDVAGTVADGSEPTGTSQPGVTLTLSGTNDVIVQSFNGNNFSKVVSAISGSYTTPADFVSGPANMMNFYGVAGWINTTSGTAPNWTTTGSTTQGFVMAVAFKEAAASSVVRHRAIVIQR